MINCLNSPLLYDFCNFNFSSTKPGLCRKSYSVIIPSLSIFSDLHFASSSKCFRALVAVGVQSGERLIKSFGGLTVPKATLNIIQGGLNSPNLSSILESENIMFNNRSAHRSFRIDNFLFPSW